MDGAVHSDEEVQATLHPSGEPCASNQTNLTYTQRNLDLTVGLQMAPGLRPSPYLGAHVFVPSSTEPRQGDQPGLLGSSSVRCETTRPLSVYDRRSLPA